MVVVVVVVVLVVVVVVVVPSVVVVVVVVVVVEVVVVVVVGAQSKLAERGLYVQSAQSVFPISDDMTQPSQVNLSSGSSTLAKTMQPSQVYGVTLHSDHH